MTTRPFIADLHIHSKYSQATARSLDLEHIYIWAQLKGIRVVGTGDFTHPGWLAEINAKLEPAESGLYRLKNDIAAACDQAVPISCRAPVRFMLSCEISSIYKKQGATRKNHNLVFFPDRQCVQRFNDRLGAIGNLNADGRPILGLDARDLLEIVLETSPQGMLVPAHIWTPWFSMLGSKSGFDSVQACFEDLSSHIVAVETGLSSDPAMNWRVGHLDGITLISNSDAHSPSKLGREANLLTTELSYAGIWAAIVSGDPDRFAGTFEFYPQEGKYHLDGHRKCGVQFSPAQTRSLSGSCPVCGKPLTLGVLHRVEALATRPQGYRPPRATPFHRLIPLDDLLSDLLKVGTQSKKVQRTYRFLLEQLGSEFNILHFIDRDVIASAGIPLLDEAIGRMRANRVSFSPGYDGLFGKARIFDDAERARLSGQEDSSSKSKTATLVALNRSERLLAKVRGYLADTSAFFDQMPDSLTVLLNGLPLADSALLLQMVPLLGYIGDDRVVWPLFGLIVEDDIDESVRRLAALQLSLAAAASDDPQALVGALVAHLDHPHPAVRANCAIALGWPDHRGAVDRLLGCLGDPDRDVREGAVVALASVGATDVLEQLAAKLQTGRPDVQRCILLNLWRFERQVGRVAATYLETMNTLPAALRLDALCALGMLPLSKVILNAYGQLLHDDDPRIRRQVIDNLNTLPAGDYGSLWDHLELLLSDTDNRVRQAAIRLFANR